MNSRVIACRYSAGARQYSQEMLWVGRLGEDLEVIAVPLGFVQQLSGTDLTGKQHYAAARKFPFDSKCDLNAIRVGQVDVAEQRVGLKVGRDRKRSFSVACSADLETVLLQNELQSMKHHRFIFDYENSELPFVHDDSRKEALAPQSFRKFM